MCVNVVFISVHQYAHLRVCECTNVAASFNAIHIVLPVKEDAISPPVLHSPCAMASASGGPWIEFSTCIHERMAGAGDGP